MPTASQAHCRFDSTLPGLGKQRQIERHAFHADVLVLPFDGREAPFWGRTDDLCHRGLFIRSRRDLPLGSFLVLKLFTGMGELELSGKIVHRLEEAGFGCEFIDLSSRQEAAISLLVSTINSAPRAARRISATRAESQSQIDPGARRAIARIARRAFGED